MRGHPDENVEKFNEYARELEMEGHKVFNPAQECPPGTDIRECFEKDYTWICRNAEVLTLMSGWKQSRGARAEQALAVALDLEIWYPEGESP
jgi:hypothetical protein